MRKKREKRPGATYHIMSRVNRQEFIFLKTVIKDLLLKRIKMAKSRFHFSLKNFCIMDNHVHLVLKPLGRTDLSALLQWIFGNFAREYNEEMGYSGHVWYDRFKSVIIEGKTQYYRTNIYLWANPIVNSKVKDIKEYKYSAYYHIKKCKYHLIDPPDPVIQECFEIFSEIY